MDRIITISDGAIRDVLAGDVEEMRGDGLVRHRVGVILARDCARRKLVGLLLAAVDEDGRERLRALVTSWEDDEARAAGHEVLDHAWGIGGGVLSDELAETVKVSWPPSRRERACCAGVGEPARRVEGYRPALRGHRGSRGAGACTEATPMMWLVVFVGGPLCALALSVSLWR